MVIYRNRKRDLCLVLPDDVAIKRFLDLHRAGKLGKREKLCLRVGGAVVEQIIACLYTIVADIYAACGGGDEKIRLMLISSAEGAIAKLFLTRVRFVCHEK